MSKQKLIEINIGAARQLVRLMDQLERKVCVGCLGEKHDDSCPAQEAVQLRNYLTQRVNNPTRSYGV